MSEAVTMNNIPVSTPKATRVSPQTTPPSQKPPGPVKTSRFKTPGEGSSVGISIVTVIVLLALWFAATNLVRSHGRGRCDRSTDEGRVRSRNDSEEHDCDG